MICSLPPSRCCYRARDPDGARHVCQPVYFPSPPLRRNIVNWTLRALGGHRCGDEHSILVMVPKAQARTPNSAHEEVNSKEIIVVRLTVSHTDRAHEWRGGRAQKWAVVCPRSQ